MDTNQEYRTSETSLAAYLVSEGFLIQIIEYDDKGRGTYVFDNSDPKLKELVALYHRGKAIGDIALYEHARNTLINRVKRGLP
jgi:hypothetical protein